MRSRAFVSLEQVAPVIPAEIVVGCHVASGGMLLGVEDGAQETWWPSTRRLQVAGCCHEVVRRDLIQREYIVSQTTAVADPASYFLSRAQNAKGHLSRSRVASSVIHTPPELARQLVKLVWTWPGRFVYGLGHPK